MILRGGRYVVDGALLVEGLDLAFTPGTTTAILGPSGCGKSTLLRLLAGLRPLSGGELSGVPTRRAFVFQDAALLPWLDVRANVALPGRFGPIGNVDEALARVGLAEHAQKLPGALSGGQRMRVSLARALVARPEVVFLDEAFAALDPMTRTEVVDVFAHLRDAAGWTVVMVTHDRTDAERLADRLLDVEGPPLRVVRDRPNRRVVSPRLEAAATEGGGHVAAHDPQDRAPRDPTPPPRAHAVRGSTGARVVGAAAVLVGLVAWEMLARRVGPFLLAAPSAVVQAFGTAGSTLALATFVTSGTSLAALLLACLTGVTAAAASWRSAWLRAALAPYLVTLQVLPIVAVAPMLVVWLGYGMAVAVATGWMAAFYPVLAAAQTGLQAPSRDLVDLLRLLGASHWKEFVLLRVPSALPALFAGLRTAAGLAVIGAIVGEFVGSNGDPPTLGFLVVSGARAARSDLAFAAVTCAALLALTLHRVTNALAQRLIGRWYGA